MTLTVVVLAAGKGSRMKSALPKVLHLLAGKPLLAHVLDTVNALSASRQIVVYGHGGTQLRDAFSARDICWVEQQPQCGTGHALQCAAVQIGNTGVTLVVCGDVPLLNASSLKRLIAAAGDCQLALLTQYRVDPTGYGRIVRNTDGEIVRIVEERDATEAQRQIPEVNAGVMVLPNAHLCRWLSQLSAQNAQQEYYLTEVIDFASREGVPIRSVSPVDSTETLGVNTLSQLAHLERLFQQKLAEQLMSQGVALYDPARIDIRGELICGSGVVIDVNCLFIGRVVLADGVRIGANCIICDSEVGSAAVIEPFSHLKGAQVGPQSSIGPYSRLRPGTVLEARVQVGNFVELKHSTVAAESKIGHLSYIGDTAVGHGVNIGAGTITCNYDGLTKHPTVIESEAFIGSGTMLVAPVQVGARATIGAGSVITADAPADALTLTRTPQRTIVGWRRRSKNKEGL